MKLRFEVWAKENKFSPAITEILVDAVSCYKNNVSRAALLLSYIAFMNILRDRILSSGKPNVFPHGEWEKLQKNITKDDSWESAVFDATQQLEKLDNSKNRIKDPVFCISESIRKQISYWKDRRNDCAHFKDNHIDSFHVDAFWAFLESNLSKITVEGGKQSLLNKFAIHFNPRFTPKDKDVTYLIKEIEYSVEYAELSDFWGLLFSLIDNCYDFMPSDRLISFMDNILAIAIDKIRTSLLDFISNEKGLLHAYLSKYPHRIAYFNYSNQEMRNFWMTELLKCEKCLDIYASMINANLIPQEETQEASVHIVKNIKRYDVTSISNLILQKNNFHNLFEEHYFKQEEFKSYLKTNSRADLLYDYLINNNFTCNTVDILCAEYSKTTHYSEWLLKRLERLFAQNIQKKEEFVNVATTGNINIPILLNEIL